MFLKRLTNLSKTLAFRLTLLYALIFTLSVSITFLYFYFLITTIIRDRVDQDLVGKLNTLSAVSALQGINEVIGDAIIETQAAGEKKIFFRLMDIKGQTFSSSNISYWRDIGVKKAAIKELLKSRGRDYILQTLSITKRKNKVRILYGFVDSGVIMQLGQSLEDVTRVIEVFKKTFFTAMLFILFFAALTGWFLARRALSGVEKVTATANKISGGAFGERVPVRGNGDEVDRLAKTFNHMLNRIEKLITGIKEMSDNIAHDLRSPITRIRGTSEVALTVGATEEDYKQIAGDNIEECDRLLGMINTMLIISKTEAGLGEVNKETIEINRVIKDACDIFQPVIADKQLDIEYIQTEKILFNGDLRMIQRLFSNILDNAIKYSFPDGEIYISTSIDKKKSAIIISVKDTGIGISPKDLPHIFERFYRCDPSRSQTGSGLGLSLARAITTDHGGEIFVSSIPGNGSCFTITFPLSS